MAPMLVRLAWHASGSYGKAAKDGGSDGGTIRFCPEIDHGGNAGLKHAITVKEAAQVTAEALPVGAMTLLACGWAGGLVRPARPR